MLSLIQSRILSQLSRRGIPSWASQLYLLAFQNQKIGQLSDKKPLHCTISLARSNSCLHCDTFHYERRATTAVVPVQDLLRCTVVETLFERPPTSTEKYEANEQELHTSKCNVTFLLASSLWQYGPSHVQASKLPLRWPVQNVKDKKKKKTLLNNEKNSSVFWNKNPFDPQDHTSPTKEKVTQTNFLGLEWRYSTVATGLRASCHQSVVRRQVT